MPHIVTGILLTLQSKFGVHLFLQTCTSPPNFKNVNHNLSHRAADFVWNIRTQEVKSDSFNLAATQQQIIDTIHHPELRYRRDVRFSQDQLNITEHANKEQDIEFSGDMFAECFFLAIAIFVNLALLGGTVKKIPFLFLPWMLVYGVEAGLWFSLS